MPPGEWLLRPGQNGLLLSISEASGTEALPDEQSISLSEGSDVYLEQRGESALTGKENGLEIPLAEEKEDCPGRKPAAPLAHTR